jgi:hypothetical protein
MLTPEETRILHYLDRHGSASVLELARACLSRAGSAWLDRVIGHLDWLGYVTLYPRAEEGPALVQLTDHGRSHVLRPGSASLLSLYSRDVPGTNASLPHQDH